MIDSTDADHTARLRADMQPAAALPLLRAAHARLTPYIRRTPTVYSYWLSETTGLEVHLKLENLQRTGAFKIRGALNRVLQLTEAELRRGLIAASAGNHAQGLALAAKLAGGQATIVMPLSTPILKVQRTEGFGARVILHGESFDQAQAHMRELAARENSIIVPAFDDPDIILGQGTAGLEFLEDAPDLDAVVIPIGGGGLCAGMALAYKALSPKTRIIGVQAAGAAPMVHSFQSGQPSPVADPRTIADGIRVGVVGQWTWELVRRHVDECITVEEDEIVDAVLQTIEKSKVVAEAAGVPGIAAILAGKIQGAKKIGTIVSGGNIDLHLMARIIENGLERAGRTHVLRLRTPDLPGQLKRIVEVLAEQGSNIVDVQHYRAGWRVPLGFVDIDVLIETRKRGEGELVERALQARGITLRT